MSTGWTFDQVGEQFDLPRLNAMMGYWEGKPPIHVMIAAYMGIKPARKITDENPENIGLIEALSAFQQG